jgi:putative transposase
MRRDRGRPLTAGPAGHAGAGPPAGRDGLPQSIVLDNGPEFAGRTLEAWAYAAGVTLCFIRPGKPIENAYVESFNGKFRDECLNEHWFVSLADAQQQIEA